MTDWCYASLARHTNSLHKTGPDGHFKHYSTNQLLFSIFNGLLPHISTPLCLTDYTWLSHTSSLWLEVILDDKDIKTKQNNVQD